MVDQQQSQRSLRQLSAPSFAATAAMARAAAGSANHQPEQRTRSPGLRNPNDAAITRQRDHLELGSVEPSLEVSVDEEASPRVGETPARYPPLACELVHGAHGTSQQFDDLVRCQQEVARRLDVRDYVQT